MVEGISNRTARPWLPPLSIATLLGVLLFCVYIGSALFSSIDVVLFGGGKHAEDVAPYSKEEESRYCQSFAGDGSLSSSEKILFIQPSGSISNRLGAIAISKHVSSTLGAKQVMVWNGREEYSDVFTEDWNDIFQWPELTTLSPGCFPGGARSHHRAQCTVLEIHSEEEWQDLLVSQTQEGATWPLCVKSSISLAQERGKESLLQDDFLRTLKPTQNIINHVDKLKNKVKWYDWGYWVGIDVVIPDQKEERIIQKVLQKLRDIVRGEKDPSSIRVVLMMDDPDMEKILYDKLISSYPDLKGSGHIVSGAAVTKHRAGDVSRNDVAKILLQSSCSVVITNESLDECETARFLGLDHCLAV